MYDSLCYDFLFCYLMTQVRYDSVKHQSVNHKDERKTEYPVGHWSNMADTKEDVSSGSIQAVEHVYATTESIKLDNKPVVTLPSMYAFLSSDNFN